jgi:hypothetical protein
MGVREKEVIKKIKENKLFWIILVFSLAGLLLRLLFIWKHSTAFTYDQARDLLDLREMWLLKKPRLIGANTSLHGVFYGPFWYWLCFPFYVLTGGHPMTNLIPILLISFFIPLVFYVLIKDKRLGFILSTLYIFSHSFFTRSIVALNTNPVIYFTPLFLVLLVKFYQEEKNLFLYLTMFLAGTAFHFEPIIGILWIPILLLSSLYLKKINKIIRNKKAVFFFIIPFLPQLIFEFRHDFLQTRAFLRLITGSGSSLTPADGGLAFRFFDRMRVFKDSFLFQNGGSLWFSLLSLGLICLAVFKLAKSKKIRRKNYFLTICMISLAMVFAGFVIYPFALWPWYLGVVDALMVTLIGLGIYYLFSWKRRYIILTFGMLIIFLFLNLSHYFPWPLDQGFSPNVANLRTRLKVVDLVYNEADNRGMKIYTFAPYVYDYPYQYLIWWRARTKYEYLPEEYYYLPNQPAYVASKQKADLIISSEKAECDFLIIEPFENQEEWFWDWRYRFPEAEKTWEIGETRVEKLCSDESSN